jgi:undecaprenyl diphosphate synthase
MDGNGRWASQRGQPRPFGHRAGVKSVRDLVTACLQRGIAVLTLFAFSSENWRRPPTEVRALMGLFMRAMQRESADLARNGVRLRFIGDLSRFSPALRNRMLQTESLTAHNSKLTLNIAVNYGGRWEIVAAARQVAEAALRGQLDLATLDEGTFTRFTTLAELPDPDLFIRTGGENRISNFLLWHLAYTEFYFTPILWPDFDETAFAAALAEYAQRERRFGRTSDQVLASTAVTSA